VTLTVGAKLQQASLQMATYSRELQESLGSQYSLSNAPFSPRSGDPEEVQQSNKNANRNA
jgi:hypothetical protein